MLCLQEVMVHACHLSIQEAEQEDRALKASLDYKVKCCQNQKAIKVVLLRQAIVSFSPFSLCGAEVWTWSLFVCGKCFILHHILILIFL